MQLALTARTLARMLAASAVLAAPAAGADVVQGVVSPANAAVVIRGGPQGDPALGAGPFQVWLAPGNYVAECQAPNSGKRVTFQALSQPTNVNIDCS